MDFHYEEFIPHEGCAFIGVTSITGCDITASGMTISIASGVADVILADGTPYQASVPSASGLVVAPPSADMQTCFGFYTMLDGSVVFKNDSSITPDSPENIVFKPVWGYVDYGDTTIEDKTIFTYAF